jgi:uncharacterized membrane protein
MGTNLSINGVDISNEGEGDETEWMPLDQVTVEVEVRNEGDSDLSDVNVEIALYDPSGNDVTGDLDFITTDEDQVDLGKINDGDKDTATFQFIVSSDLSDDTYRLAVKAYSKKSGIGEEKICVDHSSDLEGPGGIYQEIKVSKQDDDGKRIGFDNIRFSPTEASCGDTVDVSFDAVNIGDEDQDQVKVSLSNKDLNLNQSLELKGGLDQGDSESVSFTFEVPKNIVDKTYTLELFAEYDYNKGVYRQELDDAKKVSFKIFGCTPVLVTSGVQVTATSSEAKAGQPLTVTANVKNTGSSSASFVVDATGYESWASNAALSERIVNLAAGESRDVSITLAVKSGIAGAQTFNVVTLAGQNTNSKTVSVNVAAGEGFSFGSGNTLLWVIGAINLVLVIIIIIVAIRVSRR